MCACSLRGLRAICVPGYQTPILFVTRCRTTLARFTVSRSSARMTQKVCNSTSDLSRTATPDESPGPVSVMTSLMCSAVCRFDRSESRKSTKVTLVKICNCKNLIFRDFSLCFPIITFLNTRRFSALHCTEKNNFVEAQGRKLQ